jgi:hypothetical protein
MAPRQRLASHRTGQESALQAIHLMLDAGCAVNELTASDYGFDLHVLLPERYPDDAKRWPMTSRSVLLQVKGGGSFNAGVRLTREMWRFYMRSPTPVYLAVVPASGEPWIELVDRLAGHLDLPAALLPEHDDRRTTRLSPEAGTEMWNPQLFVEDARVQTAADGRRTRKKLLEWAQGGGGNPDEGFLRTLAKLAFALSGSYEGLASRVQEYLAEPFPYYADKLDVRLETNFSDYERYPLSDDWLAEVLSLDEFIVPGGGRSPEALELQALIDDLAEEVGITDLVLLSHREHFGTDDHLTERGLSG